jgi:23S rRNA U2552 (ribose-2'-O)-methylase RlmE/FtsJ
MDYTYIFDPSINLCTSHNITQQKLSFYENLQMVNKLTPSYNICTVDYPSSKYCDIKKYNILKEIQNCYDVDKDFFAKIRNLSNPFEFIGYSIFKNRAGVKLANIDAVLNITKKSGFTFDKKQSSDNFTFCDIASGPGAFTQYLQYRYPNSKGYGITIRHEFNDWNTKILNMNNFTPYYGPDNSGDLYTNCLNFIEFVKEKEPNGVDLVTGDGAFDNTYDNLEEFNSSRLLLTQIIIGIDCTKINGNFVVKVLDTVNEFSAQLIYILSLCFKSILLFKPCSSRPASSERYLVCLNRNEQVFSYLSILKNALPYYNNNDYLKSIFSDDLSKVDLQKVDGSILPKPSGQVDGTFGSILPQDFIDWLTLNNNVSINLRLLIGRNILYIMRYLSPHINFDSNINNLMYYINKTLQTKELDDETKSKLYFLKNNIVQYDINKFLTIWNLPDNINKLIKF